MWVSTVNLLPSVGGMLVDTIKDQMVMVGKLVLETIRISLIVAIVFFFSIHAALSGVTVMKCIQNTVDNKKKEIKIYIYITKRNVISIDIIINKNEIKQAYKNKPIFRNAIFLSS